MYETPMKRILASLIGSLCLTSAPVLAAETDWVNVTGGAVRVISAGPIENGSYKAGLEFSLDPGWHTYWRYSGETGVPPSLDFSGSGNVGKVTVEYPAPRRYSDGFSTSIVYEEDVVLPILITPDRPDQPVTLDTSLFFGVCKDICVPGDAVFKMTLQPDATADQLSRMLIDRDLALVPAKVAPDASGIVSITREEGEKGPILIIKTDIDPAVTKPDLFAEGPEGSYIGVPQLRSRDDRNAVWTLPAEGLARQDTGSTLTLVLVEGDKARESQHHIPVSLLN